MFTWYYMSEICYAYLSDISPIFATSSVDHLHSSIQESAWFKRGWTLQELLAPRSIEFLDRNWAELGTRSSLAPAIESATGISQLINWKDACIAQKMSWAARRETTRIEDEAYCLMGIFNVNMPLLYGEGRKAFARLQLEILAKSDDESIFAWSYDDWKVDPMAGIGLLATSPKSFKDSGSIERGNFDTSRPSYAMTNKGLRLELKLLPNYKQKDFITTPPEELAPLNCTVPINSSPNAPRTTLALRLIQKGEKHSRQPQLETHDNLGIAIYFSRTTNFVEQATIEQLAFPTYRDALPIYFVLNNIEECGFSATRPFSKPQRFAAPEYIDSCDLGTNVIKLKIYQNLTILSLAGICFHMVTNFGTTSFTILVGVSATRTWVEVLKQHWFPNLTVFSHEVVSGLDDLVVELGWPLSDADLKAH